MSSSAASAASGPVVTGMVMARDVSKTFGARKALDDQDELGLGQISKAPATRLKLHLDLAPEDRVMHFMGRPDNTRHLVVANGDMVLSPAWSIHMGAGTGRYAFVWGMTGENQAYGDVDPVGIAELR